MLVHSSALHHTIVNPCADNVVPVLWMVLTWQCLQVQRLNGKHEDDDDDYEDEDEEEEAAAVGGEAYGDGDGDPCPNCGRQYRCPSTAAYQPHNDGRHVAWLTCLCMLHHAGCSWT